MRGADPGGDPRGAPRPPFVVRLALRLLLPESERRIVLSELAEGWSMRAGRAGADTARRWYQRQAMQYAVRLGIEKFRGIGTSRRSARRGSPGGSIGDGFGDVVLAARGLVRSPLLSMTVVLTVGLGIGASTAMFAVVHTVLIRPLPYLESDRLVRIYHALQGNRWSLSAVDYEAIEEQQTAFSGIAAYRTATPTLTLGNDTERLQARLVTPGYFALLGIEPLIGRGFEAAEGEPGGPLGVLISWGLWQRQFGGDPEVLGTSFRLDGASHVVVGVLPQRAGPLNERYDVFPVLQIDPPTRKGPFFLTVLGRLAPGSTPDAAAAELEAISRRIFPIWQSSWQDETATYGVMPLREFVAGDVAAALLVLLSAVGFVLLIAAANGANLLVARTARRGHEMAVRSALGATRLRLARLLATESVLLTLASLALGMGLASAAVAALRAAGAGVVPRAAELVLGGPTGVFTAAVAVVCALVFGLVPALLVLRRPHEPGGLRSGSRTVAGGGSAERMRRALIVGEFAVAMPLLIGTGLLLGSFAKLQRVDPGFGSDGLMVATLSLPDARYSEPASAQAFWVELLERVRALPGVRGAGIADARPPRDFRSSNNFDLVDRPTPPGQSQPGAVWITADPGYLDALDIPLRAGRIFDERDGPDAPWTVLVDEAWARHFYPGEDPVGRRFRSGGCTGDDCEIATVVGVVGDVRYQGLDDQGEGSVHGTVYGSSGVSPPNFAWLFVRGRTAAMPITSVRDIVRDIDPELVLFDIASGEELVDAALSTPRNLLFVVAGFAGVALLLAVIGLYGVLAYFVQQHRREIGIRVALGQSAPSVVRLVLGRGMRPVLVGALFGLLATLAVTGYLRTVLFQVAERDATTFAGVTFVMLAAALAACLLPARRAARLDPVQTLRDE